jgi:7-cyano-7-deazaguanine synthase
MSNNNSSCIILLSAGLDSTVNLYQCIKEKWDVRKVLTFNYGQKAAQSELRQSKKICEKFNLSHQIIDLNFFQNLNSSSLLSSEIKIPTDADVDIHSLEKSKQTAKSVWVPNRNGIFLNIAAGFAEMLEASFVVTGFNKEEAVTFPDNSQGFMTALETSFGFSTQNHVKVKSYTIEMNKVEIIKLGLDLKVDWSLIWPCYFSGQRPCYSCESCLRSERAFSENGISWKRI